MRRFLLLLLIPLSFTSLAAQDTLTAGDKVRVTTEEERVVGYWVSVGDNQLTLNSEARDSSLVLPLASLTKLEVSQGRKANTLKGLGIGFLAGAGTGALIGAAVDCAAEFDLGQSFCVVLYGGIGAAVGLFVGGLAGAAIYTERWGTVPLDRIRVSLTPRGGGLEVSAEFVF